MSSLLNQVRIDLKSLMGKRSKIVSQDHIDKAKKLIKDSEGNTEKFRIALMEMTNGDFYNIAIMLQIAMTISYDCTGIRCGAPTLADTILDQYVMKIKQFGKSTYPPSEKQLNIMCKQILQDTRDLWL